MRRRAYALMFAVLAPMACFGQFPYSISTVAGTYRLGDGGPASAALLLRPSAVAVDTAGNLYILENFPRSFGRRVRKASPSGIISTLSLSGIPDPSAVAVDRSGNLYVASSTQVRKVTPAGQWGIVAGTGAYGYTGDGGPAIEARFQQIDSLAVDSLGNLYIGESVYNRVRKVDTSGIVRTVAGTGTRRYSGDGGPATAAQLDSPQGLAVDASGNLYISDTRNYIVRKVSAASGVITTVGGRVPSEGIRWTGYNGDGRLAVGATLGSPGGLAFDAEGNLYIADTDDNRIRKINPEGIISTVAGNGRRGFAGDDGTATAAMLAFPLAVTVDAAGNLYIADEFNNRIRKVGSGGTITTVAGTGKWGYSGDGGPATSAMLGVPRGVALDRAGNLYIADYGSNRVRKVNAAGVISTVAGNGKCSSLLGGAEVPATAPEICPGSLAVDAAGNLYIGESLFGGSVRKALPSGTISTIGVVFSSADDSGTGALVQFGSADALAVDAAGNVYVADGGWQRVHKLTPQPSSKLAISSGDRQSSPVNTALPSPLVVKVVGAGGAGVPGVPVGFAVTSGTASLSLTGIITDAAGLARVSVTLGSTPGPVVVTAMGLGLPPVTFNLTATEAVGPCIAAGGVAGVGGSIPPVRQISPNGLVSIYGDAFASPGTARTVGAGDLVNGRVPTKFAGVCVQVGGQWAPVVHVFPNQLNIQIPSLTGAGELSIQVFRNCGETNELKSNVEKVTLQAATPEFLYFLRNADGRNPIAAADAVTYEYIGAPGLIPGANFAPAKPGDVLTLYATGFGLTTPAFEAGQLPDTIAPTVQKVRVTVGGIELGDADVLYAGVTPGLAGVYQVNLRLPIETPDGEQTVVVRVGNFTSPPGAYVTVKR